MSEPTKMYFQTACVHGRFQLFHLDHLDYILKAKALCDQLIIGITSFNIREMVKVENAPHRFLFNNNPFTYRERTDMITAALLDCGIDECSFSFSPFPIENPEILPDFIPVNIPCFTTVREEWNRDKIKVLESIGYQVVVLKEELTKSIEGTKLRSQIVNDDDEWKSFVPVSTIKIVEQLGIKSRLNQ